MRQFDTIRTPPGGVLRLNAAPPRPAPGTSLTYERGNYRIILRNNSGTLEYYYTDLALGADQEVQYKDHDPNEFAPDDIAGLQLWVRANSIEGLSDGDPVSTWADISGNGRDGTGSGANRPTYETNVLNGLPVVRFNDTGDLLSWGDLSAAFPSAATLIVVVNLGGVSSYGGYDTNGGIDQWWRYNGDGKSYISAFRNARAEAVATMPTTGAHVFTWSSSGSGANLYIDGASAGSSAASYAAGTTHAIRCDTGGLQPPPDHAEVLIFSSVLGTTDRQNVENYLMDKYGL